MKRLVLTICLWGSLFGFLYSQNVGIGTPTPHNSALLELNSANKGFLMTRVALTGTNDNTTIPTPATGLLVYNTNTTTGANAVSPGFYYWDGTKWVRLRDTESNDWTLLGNAGTNPTTNFLGTTDAQGLSIRTNNVERIRVTATGDVGIGTATPAGKLHVLGNAIIYSKTGQLTAITQNVVGGAFTMELQTQDGAGNLATRVLLRGGSDNAAIEFYQGARGAETLRMIIATNSNVGIGTAAPTDKLHVVGTTRISSLAGVGTRPVYATNLGVLTTTPPVPDVMWRTTGNAGLTTGIHFLGTTDAVALDFRTNNIIRFRIPQNAARLLAYQNGTAAAPTYSWNADPNIGMYRSGIDQLSFATAGVERIRILSNGRVQINPVVTVPYPGGNPRLGVRMLGTDDWGIASYINVNHLNATWRATIIGNVGSGSNLGAAIRAYSRSTNTGGVALMAGYGNTVRLTADRTAITFVDDAAGGGDGDIAMYGVSSFLNNNHGIIYLREGVGTTFASWYIGYWTGLSYRKIIGDGSVSTIVKDLNDNPVIMNAPETPEILFMDFGIAEFKNGKAIVNIDPILSKNIVVDENHPLKVFIQMENGGMQCGITEVRNKSANGFTVVAEKPCNASFSWMIVANRADEYIPGKGWARYSQSRFEPFTKPPKSEFLHNRNPEQK